MLQKVGYYSPFSIVVDCRSFQVLRKALFVKVWQSSEHCQQNNDFKLTTNLEFSLISVRILQRAMNKSYCISVMFKGPGMLQLVITTYIHPQFLDLSDKF